MRTHVGLARNGRPHRQRLRDLCPDRVRDRVCTGGLRGQDPPAQIEAGAQAVQIFDTWGGILTPTAYQQFSLDYMQKIVSGLHREHEGRQVPVILFTKNGGQWLESIAASNCHCVGLDWTVDIGDARRRIGSSVSLQGNMDPSILYASPDAIRAEVARILEQFGEGEGHVFNLGHGVVPETPPEHVAALAALLRESRPESS